MHLVDPKMMMQPTITTPVNPIHPSFDRHARWWHENCFGQTRSQWRGKSQTIQPNLATLFGISRPSQDSIPTQGSQHGQGWWNHQSGSRKIQRESRKPFETYRARTDHALERAWRICSQWSSHQREQHSRFGEWCRETTERFSSTWLAGICPCSP